MKTWLLVLFFGCATLHCSADAAKIKVPKAVKQLNTLCLAGEADLIDVKEEEFDFVIGELNDTCDIVLDVLNGTGKTPSKAIDGIKYLKKICKWYTKSYDSNNTNINLDDFGTVCEYYDLADNSGLTDKVSRKTLKKVADVCKASKRGKLSVKNESYAGVFADMEDFCVDYLNETNNGKETPKANGNVNGIKFMDSVCDWLLPKFNMVEEIQAPGVLNGLVPICKDFVDVRDGKDFDVTEEPMFETLVELCVAEGEDSLMDYDERYDGVFEDLAGYCENMDETVTPKYGRKPFNGVMAFGRVCKWTEEVTEREGEIAMLADLQPICEDFVEVQEEIMGDFNLTEEREFELLVSMCIASDEGSLVLNNTNFTEIFDDFEDFCVEFLEDLAEKSGNKARDGGNDGGRDGGRDGEGGDGERPPPPEKALGYVCKWYGEVVSKVGGIEMLNGLGDICTDYEELVDVLYPFDLMKERPFQMLLGLCDAVVNGNLSAKNDSKLTELFGVLEGVCVDLLDEFDDFNRTRPQVRPKKKPQNGAKPVQMLMGICKWYAYTTEEEGEIPELRGLSRVCEMLKDIAEEMEKASLLKEREFRALVGLCIGSLDGNLTVTNGNFSDIFDDFNEFCGPFVDGVLNMTNKEGNYSKKQKSEEEMKTPNPIMVLKRSCDWFWEFSEEKEGIEELFEGFEQICEDLEEVFEDLDEDDLLEDEEFGMLKKMCMQSVYGNFTARNGNFTEVFDDFEDFCVDFLADLEDLFGNNNFINVERILSTTDDEYLSDYPKMRAGPGDGPKVIPPFKKLGFICEWYGDKVEENGEIDLLSGLGPVCEDYEKVMDELYPFDVRKEMEFRALVMMCKADENGNLTVTNENYTDIFDDFGEFCGALLDNVTDDMNDKEPKMVSKPKPKPPSPIIVLAKLCDWFEEVTEEEGEIELLDGMDTICSDLWEVIEDDEQTQVMLLMAEKEFGMLMGLCIADSAGVLVVDDEYTDIFDDLGDLCDDLFDDLTDILGGDGKEPPKSPGKRGDKPGDKPGEEKVDPVDVLEDVCEWYEDEVSDNSLLDDLQPICEDLAEINEE